jgi:hypothetical protein
MRMLRPLAQDAAFLALFSLVTGPAAAATAWLARRQPLSGALAFLLAPALAYAFLAAMIGTAWLVRLCLPRLVPGNHPFPGSRAALAWLLHFALARVLALPAWSWLVNAFSTLRWAALRARGARVPLDFDMSLDARVGDAPLVTVEPGAMLAAETQVTGHFIEEGRLLLDRVRIGAGAQVLARAAISPGCDLAAGAVVGPGSALAPRVRLGANARLGFGCVLQSDVEVGEDAVVGHQATLENHVTLGAGAVVAAGARVPRGTKVGDNERFPPRAARQDAAEQTA